MRAVIHLDEHTVEFDGEEWNSSSLPMLADELNLFMPKDFPPRPEHPIKQAGRWALGQVPGKPTLEIIGEDETPDGVII